VARWIPAHAIPNMRKFTDFAPFSNKESVKAPTRYLLELSSGFHVFNHKKEREFESALLLCAL
jgi:hypothetical protein